MNRTTRVLAAMAVAAVAIVLADILAGAPLPKASSVALLMGGVLARSIESPR